MAHLVFHVIGQSSYGIGNGAYKAFIDYGIAKYFMNTSAKTAALFGALEGFVTHVVLKPAYSYIINLGKAKDTPSSEFGKNIVCAIIYFASLKVHQLFLTFMRYPIDYPTAVTLGIVNLVAQVPISIIQDWLE